MRGTFVKSSFILFIFLNRPKATFELLFQFKLMLVERCLCGGGNRSLISVTLVFLVSLD